MEWSTFLAWHALTRESQISGVSYEDFCERRAISVEPQIEERDTVNPTRPALEAD